MKKTYIHDKTIINTAQINYIKIIDYNNSLEIWFSSKDFVNLRFNSKSELEYELNKIINLIDEN